MKLFTITALVATMGLASTALAQRVQAPKPKANANKTAPKAQTPQAKASATDGYLSTITQINKGQKLAPAVSAQTCNGTSIIQSVSSVLKGSEKTAFTQAAALVNGGSQGIVLQPCQAGEPITQEASLINLAKITINVGEKIQKNQGSANDVNTWGKAISEVIPGITLEQGIERAQGLASSKCQLLKI